MSSEAPRVACCIVGCGPAGAMLGLLLARAGVGVVVLEKHGDFLRDFRGDTIHPSILENLAELGLAERFLELPHSEVRTVSLQGSAGGPMSFSLEGLPTRFPFLAFVPQWDFLSFVTGEASRLPAFHLRMQAEVTELIREGGVVRGVRYRTADGGAHEARAVLTVGADGRHSRTREAAGLQVLETSPPMDVLWFRLSRHQAEDAVVGLRFGAGQLAALIDRGEYWQIAYVIPKGGADRVRAEGLDAFRRRVAAFLPWLADRVDEIRDWEQVKLLTVRADRLERWYTSGYLAIGDAAHAMSPIAGVGINVAIQDAVCAANVLWRPLREGRVSVDDLVRVQRRREWPVRVIQGAQGLVQRLVIKRLLAAGDAAAAGSRVQIPVVVRLLAGLPFVRSLPPRLVALGVGRPHVESPELPPGR